ncbi:MAG: hypothetical protein WBM65_20975, partial [Sedimenticolaceae bacterium]
MTRSKRIIRLNPLCAAMRGAAAPFWIPLAGVMLLQTGVMADQSAWDCRATPDGRSWQCLERG